jgi:hypothetical protein
MNELDLSHTINHLSFGEREDVQTVRAKFSEGILDPLDGSTRKKEQTVQTTFEYYLKVVPTTYEAVDGSLYSVHQFTANTNDLHDSSTALYFRYELSPVTIRYTQSLSSLFHFIVQICAIVGGIFTVVGIVDSMIHAGMQRLLKGNKVS